MMASSRAPTSKAAPSFAATLPTNSAPVCPLALSVAHVPRSHLCPASRTVRVCGAFPLRACVAVLLHLNEMAKPVELLRLCCTAQHPCTLAALSVAILGLLELAEMAKPAASLLSHTHVPSSTSAVLLELTELAKPVERPRLCCLTHLCRRDAASLL